MNIDKAVLIVPLWNWNDIGKFSIEVQKSEGF